MGPLDGAATATTCLEVSVEGLVGILALLRDVAAMVCRKSDKATV